MTRSGPQPHRSRRRAGSILCLALLLATGPGSANCETGAYLIHTIAGYAEYDGADTWFFRTGLRSGELQLTPVAAETEFVIWRLHRLLESPEGGSFTMEREGRSCRPRLDSVRLARPDETMDRLVLRLAPCLDLPVEDSIAVYDRSTRRLVFPPEVEIAADTLRPDSALRDLALSLELEIVPGSAPIREENVESVRVEQFRVGTPGAAIELGLVVLRLRDLGSWLEPEPDTILAGILGREELRDLLADFPVLFLTWPGHPPSYFGDGSWCADHRLALGLGASGDREIGVLDRFEPSRAWDSDADGLPDLLEIRGGLPTPSTVLYRLGHDPTDPVLVVDHPLGC